MSLDLKPGTYSIEEDEYHKLTAFSNTDLKLIARSPAHYYAARLDPAREEKEPTPAMIAGRILHCAILEPDLFDSRFVVVHLMHRASPPANNATPKILAKTLSGQFCIGMNSKFSMVIKPLSNTTIK